MCKINLNVCPETKWIECMERKRTRFRAEMSPGYNEQKSTQKLGLHKHWLKNTMHPRSIKQTWSISWNNRSTGKAHVMTIFTSTNNFNNRILTRTTCLTIIAFNFNRYLLYLLRMCNLGSCTKETISSSLNAEYSLCKYKLRRLNNWFNTDSFRPRFNL